MANDLTIAQLLAALGWVVAAILGISKLWKAFFGNEPWKDIKKGFPLISKYIWRDAIFRKDMMNKVDEMFKIICKVQAEVNYNGGNSTKDMVRKTSTLLETVTLLIETCNKRMDIADLANERMTFRIDTDGACTEINEVFLKKFGYSEDDVKGFAFEQIVVEDDVKEMRVKWQRAITQKGRFYDEQRIYDSGGIVHECCVRGFPVEINGKLIEFTGYIEFLNKTHS